MAETGHKLGENIWKVRLIALVLLVAGILVGSFVYGSEVKPDSRFPFKFGLDLLGGTHLIYRADISNIRPEEVKDSMSALRDVIERRVNLFGVAEPIVQVERGGRFAGVIEERLIIELPGVTDIGEAIALIGQTPLLEFKLFDESIPASSDSGEGDIQGGTYVPTDLTGRFLKRAQLEFGSTGSGGLSNEPIVALEFDREGAKLFEQITRDNIGRILGIFLDGEPISTPVIRDAITGGRATISGSFTPEEARLLVRNLNFGALPLPIELISTQTIGASLGEEAIAKGLFSGIVGLSIVALFMIAWYRLPGVLAVVSLSIYISVMLSIFKLIPVTLTAAGVAGFILSIGLAVDANVLIFERMKEEFKDGKDTADAVRNGFSRAWLAIRDGNISSIITAVILFWFGTSIVEGFALTFGVGIVVSMLTAITITRTFLYALGKYEYRGATKFLFGSGIGRN
ncbi:protein translocase subunit SecD [Patescibacteria group bacterium]|nr:protein translocase subunit SecD [Patescibacteria group bacterium]